MSVPSRTPNKAGARFRVEMVAGGGARCTPRKGLWERVRRGVFAGLLLCALLDYMHNEVCPSALTTPTYKFCLLAAYNLGQDGVMPHTMFNDCQSRTCAACLSSISHSSLQCDPCGDQT